MYLIATDGTNIRCNTITVYKRQMIRQSNKGAKGKMKKKNPKKTKQTKTQSSKYCLLKDFDSKQILISTKSFIKHLDLISTV